MLWYTYPAMNRARPQVPHLEALVFLTFLGLRSASVFTQHRYLLRFKLRLTAAMSAHCTLLIALIAGSRWLTLKWVPLTSASSFAGQHLHSVFSGVAILSLNQLKRPLSFTLVLGKKFAYLDRDS
jgi:hypothetical protein